MIKKYLILFLLMMFVTYGCSQKEQSTSATLKINLSKIVNVTSGIGSGGAILFGKSANGEQFGKVIAGVEENLELPNGDWVFYSVMWLNNYNSKMSDVAYCGKSSQKLSGVATTVTLNLTNANCVDTDFSGGNSYVDTNNFKNYFSKLLVEECEDISLSGSYGCNADNQGSARSYRLVFKSYRGLLGAPVFGADRIEGSCVPFTGGTSLHANGMGVNFPTGSSSSMPFVVSLEMFLGSDNCSSVDPKGIYTHTFNVGLSGFQPGITRFMTSNPNTCSVRSSSIAEEDCKNYLGTFSGTCSASFPAVVDKFLPDSTCQSGLSSDPSKYIKQMVSIPKNLLCGGILNTAVVTGDNPFSGGKGVKYRPYKICNEWQLNQIGERNTLLGSAYDSSFYKLMNHLDMNKASNVAGFAAYPAPVCAGDTAAKIDQFHNLNPLDGHLCGAGVVTSEVGFTGDFDGAGYSISNGRISTENLSQVGFVRLLGTREVSGSSGTIRRLQFKNLSIRGDGYIGGIAGDSNGAGLISDVKIDKLDVEGKNYVGGAIGYHQGSGFKILKTRINNAKIRGVDNIGGLVGYSSLLISESSFRGVITSDDSSSPYFAGGLVGINNASGSISSSFSEGFISTHTSYIGGIAGKNFGTLTNVYSTMGISSLRNSPGTVSAAGIAPYNSGTITNCFSDTRKMYVGGATFGHDGIVLTDAGTVTNCLTDVLNSSTFVSGSYSQVRTNSWLSSNFMSPGGSWQYGAVDGMTPRLSWETRECLLANNLLSVSSQVSTLARGSTQDNPVVICNLSQLQSISARGASEFYRLGEDINLSSMGIVSNSVFAVDTLNGKLNGNGKALYGLDVGIDNVMDNSVGIFKTVSSGAKISNLNLYANRVYISADTVNGIGLLTNINSGELQNINSFGSSMIGTQSLGGVAAQNTNSGVIKNVRLEGVHIVGDSYIGSVAAQNTGRIEAVSTLVNIGSSNSAFAVGGIAGQNNPDGVIEQVTAEGSFNLTNGAPRNIGGIIGVNYGKLFNSYVSDNTSMNLAITASSEALGGVVGSNESGAQLGNLFFLGKMIGTQSSSDLTSMLDTDSTTDERELGPIIGKNNGGIFSNILSVNDYLLWGNSSANVSSCDDTTNTIILTATPGIASGALLHHSFSFLIPYTSSSLSLSVSGFSLTGQCPANGDYLTLYESYHNYGEYGSVVSISGMGSLATYSGFSVGLGDSAGVIGYHMAKTYNTSIPASSPIWVMDSGEDYPRLLRVERD